jgi:hypothetical protein
MSASSPRCNWCADAAALEIASSEPGQTARVHANGSTLLHCAKMRRGRACGNFLVGRAAGAK